jgi:hypothetical protein
VRTIQTIRSIDMRALRSLEKKGYLKKASKKWCLQFKGIIVAILIQKTPRPLSSKWADLVEYFAKDIEQHFSTFTNLTVQANGVTFRPFEAIKETAPTLRTFDDWVALSKYVNSLIQRGVVNLDVISNHTLFMVILTELFSSEQLKFNEGLKFQSAR